MTWESLRAGLAAVAELRGDWHGIPVPLPDLPVVLHARHPMRETFRRIDGVEMEIQVGGPTLPEGYTREEIVNHWVSYRHLHEVFIWKATGAGMTDRYYHVKVPLSPEKSMERLTLWLRTIGAVDAWGLDAEYAAREKLRDLLSSHQWRCYDLTGSFFETSPRSGLTYLFRRLRPTVAITPRWPWWHRSQPEGIRCLAVLCLHPVGYYRTSWAGCMVPTDDVISHLLLMRGDEARFWKLANQHESWSPEAGL